MEIVVPELGESIVEATVARWLKNEGDHVTVGEPVVELETDKVNLEVGSRQDGVLARILHPEGQDVKVGEVLGIVEAAAEAGGAATAASAPEEAPAPGTAPAPAAAPQATPASAAAGQEAAPAPRGNGAAERAPDRVTPVARRFAEDHGVDLAQVAASAPGERITKEDVQRFVEAQAQPAGGNAPAAIAPPVAPPAPAAAPTQAPAAAPPPQPAPSPAGQARREERLRMSRRRRTIATRLVEALQTTAMLTTFNDVDMSAVMEIRKRRREEFQKRYGIKLGFMSFFVKASIGALRDFPHLNAEILGDEILLKHYYDIGIAIGAEEGLVVPVLRDADRMSFAEIEKGIQDFGQKVENGTLSLEDLRGGTFTITNGGVFGSLLSTPILNPPQVGILGMHRIEERPVGVNGQVAIRPMMYLALSYDHRIVDGREAVQFLVRLKEFIQDPEALLLQG